ncbi:hypothetical protein Pmani_000260 [Petrolisthes manimaculis]|uniref:Uncharacterized protein n=1 Tax=Petrolisthes manimaculis TaxID=1843537 RepID=A0AAE1USX8_9EUCA|nr:hypothetical protein Pmani_000260 [Petrolisthes manimaculis]
MSRRSLSQLRGHQHCRGHYDGLGGGARPPMRSNQPGRLSEAVQVWVIPRAASSCTAPSHAAVTRGVTRTLTRPQSKAGPRLRVAAAGGATAGEGVCAVRRHDN